MNRPSFQFYPADWRNNAKLRRCSEAARGAWMDVMCVLHDSDEYGIARWPLADLARAAGVPLKLLRELVDKDVLKGGDKRIQSFIYTPRHARGDCQSVVLIDECDGPCWYSSRMVRDEHVRQRRGVSSQFTTENQPPKHSPKASPMDSPKAAPKPPFGERQGDGASSSSSSSKDQEQRIPSSTDADASPADPIFGLGLAFLKRKGLQEKTARAFLGLLRKELHDDLAVSELLTEAERQDVSEPQSWLSAAARRRKTTLPQSNSNGSPVRAVFDEKQYSGSSQERIDAII